MFDAIGRNPDDEFTRRRATAVTITLLGTAGVVGLTIGLMAYTAVETVLDPIVDEAMVELVTEKAVPDQPPPPPPPAGRADLTEVADEPEVVPDEVVEDVAELEEQVQDEIASSSATAGTDGGVAGGEPGGVPHGTPGGDGVPGFPASELAVKKRIYPEYPEAARELNLGDQRCVAVVVIDEEGVPYEVTVQGCPSVFERPTREAMFQWRWYPPKDGPRRVKARTTIAVTYRVM